MWGRDCIVFPSFHCFLPLGSRCNKLRPTTLMSVVDDEFWFWSPEAGWRWSQRRHIISFTNEGSNTNEIDARSFCWGASQVCPSVGCRFCVDSCGRWLNGNLLVCNEIRARLSSLCGREGHCGVGTTSSSIFDKSVSPLWQEWAWLNELTIPSSIKKPERSKFHWTEEQACSTLFVLTSFPHPQPCFSLPGLRGWPDARLVNKSSFPCINSFITVNWEPTAQATY